ncbi:MAG: hypothetical protein WCT29_00795 [Candidatus Paceibacterota bacterium]|jgi:hypothetical protein
MKKFWLAVEGNNNHFTEAHLMKGGHCVVSFGLEPGLRLGNGTLTKYISDELESRGYELLDSAEWSPLVFGVRSRHGGKKK